MFLWSQLAPVRRDWGSAPLAGGACMLRLVRSGIIMMLRHAGLRHHAHSVAVTVLFHDTGLHKAWWH